jgi:hypothetical protein
MSLLSTTMLIALTSGESNVFGGVSVANESFTHQAQSSQAPLVNGTGAGQANHSVNLLLNCGTGGVSLDLTACGAGSGLDGKNRDFSNANSGGVIKAFLIENLDPTNSITVTQPGSNGWTGISGAATGLSHVIEPGGCLVVYAPVSGKAVSSTNKLLTLTGSAGTPQAKISITGVAA